jgi:hypothetical protein
MNQEAKKLLGSVSSHRSMEKTWMLTLDQCAKTRVRRMERGNRAMRRMHSITMRRQEGLIRKRSLSKFRK